MSFYKFLTALSLVFMWNTRLINALLLHFPPNSAHGIFAALAIPLELPNRSVFFSYNFEANYNLPGKATDFTAIPPQWGEESRNEKNGNANKNSTSVDDPTIQNKNSTDSSERVRRSLISRKILYTMLMDKFQHGGLSGEPCLLKLICETNASYIGDHNGILGHILHVLFSPTTSVNEHLPKRFYDAETNGLDRKCFSYEKRCPHKMLDLISKSF